MNLAEKSIAELRRPPRKFDWLKAFLPAVISLVLAPVLLLLPPYLASISPVLSLTISWMWLSLPGYLFAELILRRLPWLERIPFYFLLGLAVSTPYTAAAILMRMTLEQYKDLSIAAYGVMLLLFVAFRLHSISRPQPAALSDSPEQPAHDEILPETLPFEIPASERISIDADEAEVVLDETDSLPIPETTFERFHPGMLAFLLLILACAGMFLFFSGIWPPNGDDIAGLPAITEALRLERITGTEPFHGTGTPVTPRNEMTVWLYQNVLSVHIARLSADLFFPAGRPILIFLALLSLFTFLHQFFRNQRLALFLMSLWSIYLLSTMQKDGTGNDMITRISQDKFAGWLIVVPLILVLLKWYLESGKKGYLAGFWLGSFAAALMHPITLVQVMMLGGSFGFVMFLQERSRPVFIRLLWLLAAVLFSLTVPVIQYLRYSEIMPVVLAGLEDTVTFGRISMATGRYRLWLLNNNHFILHPSYLINPVVLAGYIAAPFLLVGLLKKNRAASLLVAGLIAMPALFFVPQLASLVGKAVTPYLIWRLAWPMVFYAVFTIGWAVWALSSGIAALFGRLHARAEVVVSYALLFASLGASAWWAVPNVRNGMAEFVEDFQAIPYSTCVRARQGLVHLDELTYTASADVLASSSLNFCIPGFAPLANVVEFRGFGTVNRLPDDLIADSLQRAADADYFSSTTHVDDLVLDAIKRWDIEYVAVEKDRYLLDMQLHLLPQMFASIYSDSYMTIYQVNKDAPPPPVVNGNTRLRLRQWNEAEKLFEDILHERPDAPLARLGLAQALEGKGDLERATAEYERALALMPDEPGMQALMATTYLLLRQPQQALQAAQRADELSPGRAPLLVILGQIANINRDDTLARASLEQAAGLQWRPGTAYYYDYLNSLFGSIGWNKLAVEQLTRAVAISPTSNLYSSLASAYLSAGEPHAAQRAANQAIKINPWADYPYQVLGGIFSNMGDLNGAVSALERAWRLNPANSAAFAGLGSAISERDGPEAAVARLNELTHLNDVLPGPYRALGSLYQAQGDLDQALQYDERASKILVRDASIVATMGDIYRLQGKNTQALQSYDQTLSMNADQISARVGIATLYQSSSQIGPQMGQYYYLARLQPRADWPRLSLVGGYQSSGRWDQALAEIQFAQRLNPANPSVYRALGDYYRTLGNYQDAARRYQAAIALQPDSPDAYISLSGAYKGLGQVEDARDILKFALEPRNELKDSDLALILYNLANLEVSSGNFSAAEGYFRQAIKKNPEYTDADLGLSRLFLIQGRLDEYQQSLEAIVKKEPDALSAYKSLSDLMLTRHDPQAALRWLEQGVQANPDSPTAIFNLGDEYRRRGQMTEAQKYSQRAIELNPYFVQAYEQLQTIARTQGIPGEAEKIYLAQAAAAPYLLSPWSGLGDLYAQRGLFAEAESAYRKALTIVPASASVYQSLSSLRRLQGDQDGALDFLLEAEKRFPSSADAALNLGNYWMWRSNPEQARRYFERAIDLNPGLIAAYFGINQVDQGTGDFAAARATLELAVQQNPSSIPARQNLASFYESFGLKGLSEAQLLAITRQEPANSTYLQNLGQFYQRQSRLDEARTVLERAFQIPPNPTSLYSALASLDLQAGDEDAARLLYEQALQTNPTDPTAYLNLSTYYSSREQLDLAIQTLQKAQAVLPVNPDVSQALGGLYNRTNKLDLARQNFELACEQSLSSTSCRNSLGNLYRTQGLWQHANALYSQAIAINPSDLTGYVSLSQSLFYQGKSEEALGPLNRAVSVAQDRLGALQERAAFFQNLGRWQEAQTDLEQAWKLFPYSQSAGGQLATFYRARGEWEKAIDLRLSMAALPDAGAANQVELGSLYFSRGLAREAEGAYRTALRLDPSYALGYTSLSGFLSSQGKTDESLQILKDAVKAGVRDPSIPQALGDYYLNALDYAAAKAEYEKAMQLSSSLNLTVLTRLDNLTYLMTGKWGDLTPYEARIQAAPTATAYTTIAAQYVARGDWQTAQSWYEAAVGLEPYNAYAWYLFGNFYRVLSQWDKSIDPLQKALKYTPYNASAWVALGSSYQSLERDDDAVAAFDKAIESDPTSATPYVTLSGYYSARAARHKNKKEYALSTEKYDLAVATLQRGMEASPASVEIYNNLGLTYLTLEREQDALDTYNRGLEILPGSPVLYVSRGNLRANTIVKLMGETSDETYAGYVQEEFEKFATGESSGVPDLIQAAQTANADAQARLRAAAAIYRWVKSDLQAARADYELALALQPNNLYALLGIGNILAASGDNTAAIAYYQKAIDTNLYNIPARNALGQALNNLRRYDEALAVFQQAVRLYPSNLTAGFGLITAQQYVKVLDLDTALRAFEASHYWWQNWLGYFRAYGN